MNLIIDVFTTSHLFFLDSSNFHFSHYRNISRVKDLLSPKLKCQIRQTIKQHITLLDNQPITKKSM